MQPAPGPHTFRARLRRDQTFYLELQFCNEHGLAHSAFLSWHEEDRGKALAFEIEKSLRCPLCGTAQWEWDANRFAYEATHERCMGCYIRESASHEVNDSPGVTVQLSATGTPEAKARRREAEAMRRRDQESGD